MELQAYKGPFIINTGGGAGWKRGGVIFFLI